MGVKPEKRRFTPEQLEYIDNYVQEVITVSTYKVKFLVLGAVLVWLLFLWFKLPLQWQFALFVGVVEARWISNFLNTHYPKGGGGMADVDIDPVDAVEENVEEEKKKPSRLTCRRTFILVSLVFIVLLVILFTRPGGPQDFVQEKATQLATLVQGIVVESTDEATDVPLSTPTVAPSSTSTPNQLSVPTITPSGDEGMG